MDRDGRRIQETARLHKTLGLPPRFFPLFATEANLLHDQSGILPDTASGHSDVVRQVIRKKALS
jgi:hypothetical protein